MCLHRVFQETCQVVDLNYKCSLWVGDWFIWCFLQDEDALVKLHYGIVPRKNYFEYFARDGAASSRVNSSDKVNNSSDKVNNSSDKVNNSSSSVVTISSGVMNPGSGVVTPSSGVTAAVDTVTVDDSDDCIIIS